MIPRPDELPAAPARDDVEADAGARVDGARVDGARVDGARVDGARVDDARDDDDHADVSEGLAPGPRPGHRTPPRASAVGAVQAWAPVAAGVLRATAGLVMFAASLLTLPATLVTPMLSGVSLVMIVGGVAATHKASREDVRLRRFGRWFAIIVALLAGVAVVATVVLGAGAFAPDLAGPRPAPPRDDGTIRFVAP